MGAGHSGCESALACARTGLKTLLLTLNLDTVGQMSCNPSIGGLGKGQVVREVDALGGEMAKITDRAGLQFRILNRSKGPAVQSPRAQCDKKIYQLAMKHVLEQQKNLDVKQGEAASVLTDTTYSGVQQVAGILTRSGIECQSKAVILTTGTFMKGLLHYGLDHFPGGRAGDGRSESLSDSLREMGFEVGRMKTGTPMRINAHSVDFSKCSVQPGDEPPTPFSHFTEKITQEQMPCHLTYTNELTHQIIRENLDRSPLYSGKIKSIGPRYCPSIEDKVMKFPHHKRHQVFLEPEGYRTEEIYVNGLFTSLPEDVQILIVRTIPGLENSEIMRAGYAVEYDFCPPTQCFPTLETKLVAGLYFAGQICGTTGYEEAAGQGMLAGINASLKIRGEEPLILQRDESYIGVMIDDLVTKGVDEPYRLFTSRAEYRLHLRSDNADLRLMDHGHRAGLISDETYRSFSAYRSAVQDNTAPRTDDFAPWTDEKVNAQIAVQVKYAGYLARQDQMVAKLKKMEGKQIPPEFDFDKVPGLLAESRQKLKKVLPRTLAQASRIPGLTPSDAAILLVYVTRHQRAKKETHNV